MTPSLVFRIYQWDDLGTMLHQFCLGKNPSATRKILKSRVDQHKVFAGVVGAPTLDDLASLTAPNSISLQESFPMYQILRIRLCVVLEKNSATGPPQHPQPIYVGTGTDGVGDGSGGIIYTGSATQVTAPHLYELPVPDMSLQLDIQTVGVMEAGTITRPRGHREEYGPPGKLGSNLPPGYEAEGGRNVVGSLAHYKGSVTVTIYHTPWPNQPPPPPIVWRAPLTEDVL